MEAKYLLEAGDLILYQTTEFSELVIVDQVYRSTVTILMPGGHHLLLDRATDGIKANLPEGRENPFATQTVIPKLAASGQYVYSSPVAFDPFYTYSTNLIFTSFERLFWILRKFIASHIIQIVLRNAII